jgi:mono/diheme cytochrome c family protein
MRVVVLSLLLLTGCRFAERGVTPERIGEGASTSPSGRQYHVGVSQPDATPEEFMATAAPRGDQLYLTLCASCHGPGGRGDGRVAAFCRVPPADFTRAEFKVRSTRIGALPTDRDLADLIGRGAGGEGAMPSFAFLSPDDVRALVGKVKSFSPRWARERPPPPVVLPPRVAGDPRRGADLYQEWGCDACHGAQGAGDGRLAPSLRHARGFADVPTDLTRPWTFKAGGEDLRLLRSIVTGFSGTGMAALAPLVRRGSDLWDLVAHLRSLQQSPPEAPRATIDTATVQGYWRAPLAAQTGTVGSTSCASCHPLQFADWSRSRHAMAMGPGVFAKMLDRNAGGACMRCHAPLAEQGTDAYLRADGVTCAACHLRAGEAFGPPPTPRSLLPLVAAYPSPHGKVTTRSYFEEADFCAGCHHFPAGTAPTVHGTTLQNTLEEWRRSRAAREGRTCQTCHMPGRRHFFRGIHDPDTVRRAASWTFDVNPWADGAKARMTLTNAGAGHSLPTYVVPEIWMRIELKDRAGATLAFVEHRIARKVTFEGDDWTETSDTRLAPDETATLDYTGPMPRNAVSIVGRVIVLPDAWQADSFRSHGARAQSDTVRRYYGAALDEAESSGYTLYQTERRLDR